MSFRNEPRNDEQWMAKVDSDIRKLFKCCGKRIRYSVTATAVPSIAAGERTSRWIPGLGSVVLRSLQLSASPAPAAVPLVVHVLKNGVMVAEIVLDVGSEIESFSLAVPVTYLATDFMEFLVISGSAGYTTMTAFVEAPFVATAGLVFG